jgi:predicted nucleic acid-binding Zn ribbon protein
VVSGDSSRLFCPACERIVERGTSDGGKEPACPNCGGALVGPHPDPCPRCGGALAPDGQICVDCGTVIETSRSPRSRGSRLASSLLVLVIGVLLGWKDVASVQSGVFTRGGWRHDIIRGDEPIWFWANVSLTGFGALLCLVAGLSIVVSAIGKRGSTGSSWSVRL